MPRSPRSSWRKFALWSLPVLLLAVLGGGFVIKRAIDAYLRSERFRAFLAQKAGGTLQAEAEVAPLHFASSNLYADSVTAHGTSAAKFSSLELDGLRAELSWRRFFQQVWQVEEVEVQRLRIDLAGPRLDQPETPKVVHEKVAAEQRSRWLPDRVEIGTATIRDTEITWAGGGLHGTVLQIQPSDGGWNIAGSGGTIEHAKLPPLSVQRLDLSYRGPMLFVKNAEFRQGEHGSATATGEIDLEHQLDLRATLRNIALTPWLAGDWRARLHGEATGEIAVRSPLPLRDLAGGRSSRDAAGATRDPGPGVAGAPPSSDTVEISGNLTLTNGQLEALPVLDEIAAFTRTQQFRKLTLTRASCDFTRIGPALRVRNFIAESEGLIRIEGTFTVENSVIDGTFQIGVAPSSLQWLPGSRTRVFTEVRGAYVWAPMHLAGPLNSPTEDLTPRLAAAAGNEVIEQVGSAVKDATKTMKDGVKSALDLLLGPSK